MSSVAVKPDDLTDLTGDLIDSLHAFTCAGAAKLRIRLFETGGVLTGPANHAHVADRLEEIPCEHRFGPHFTLSPGDLESAAGTVEHAVRSGENRCVRGYFRTGSESRVEPVNDDFDAIRRLVPDCLYFVIGEPVRYGHAILRQFVPDGNGGWVLRRQLAMGADWRPHASREQVRVLPSPQPSPAPPRRRRALVWTALAAALALVLTGALAWLRWGSVPWASGTGSAFGLRVQLQGSGVLVAWDRRGLASRQPGGAVLVIHDGPQQREIALSRRDLAGGSLLYQPSFQDVSFELKTAGPVARSESVRVLNMSLPKPGSPVAIPNPVSEPAPQAPEMKTALRPKRVMTGESARLAPVDVAPRNRTAFGGEPGDRPLASLETPQQSGASVPDSEQETVSNLSLSDPPSKPAALSPGTAQPSEFGASMSAAMAAIKDPPWEPLEPVRLHVSRAAVHPPLPLHRVSPQLFGGMAAYVKFPLLIDLQVSIDERGNVKDAHLVKATPGTNHLLIVRAMNAASQWTFEPAKLGGTPVESTHEIMFNLQPPH